jgi:hypothetical protein
VKIPRILVRKNNFKLGLFLGSFVSIFQVSKQEWDESPISKLTNIQFTECMMYFQFVEYLSTILRKKKDSFNSLIAGNMMDKNLA